MSLVILSSVFLTSCREESSCFTPPSETIFEFISPSGENLLQNGTLNASKIIIQQIESSDTLIGVKFKVRDDHKISLENIGWYEGVKNYQVYLMLENEAKTFKFKVSSSKIAGDCAGYKIDDFQLEEVNYSKINGVYRIVID